MFCCHDESIADLTDTGIPKLRRQVYLLRSGVIVAVILLFLSLVSSENADKACQANQLTQTTGENHE